MEQFENVGSNQAAGGQVPAEGGMDNGTASGSVSRPVFMPETFTGQGRDWSDWSQQFALAADVNNWNDDLKLKFMSLLLSGKARDVYCGLTEEERSSYVNLRVALNKCFDPCESEDWNRASFSSRRRVATESAREFGNALRRLVSKAYPSANGATQDLLAREHFVAHVGVGELRIQLRSAKPTTLEAAINLASELELIRDLEHSQITTNAKICGVLSSSPDPQMTILLQTVEGLRQEVKALKRTVDTLSASPSSNGPISAVRAPRVGPQVSSRTPKERSEACWECGCNRHLRKDCPYLSGNSRE